MINALLLSNSTMPGTDFFTWPRQHVREFLPSGKRLVFIPYAAVTFSYDDYFGKVNEVFTSMGYKISSIHNIQNKKEAIGACDGIIVGGGNTFALLDKCYREHILDSIKARVSGGVPYIGWSAGANLGCPTIMTTNDMPVVQPESFKALELVPFQVNPHYHELKFEGQGGETRKERLEEFITKNPDRKVIGLPEGMFLRRSGDKLSLGGVGEAKLYEFGKGVNVVRSGDVSYLLR
jgi:dipeptidase E